MPELRLAWAQTGERRSWVAVAGGALLTVSRTAYGWQAEVCWDRNSPAETSEFSGYYRTRKAAQAWAERQARP
jgi:hypothetical protein